jgi:hypothetical protein
MRDVAIKEKPALKDKLDLFPEYAPHMGLIDDLKATGRKIAVRWSKELYTLVCGQGAWQGVGVRTHLRRAFPPKRRPGPYWVIPSRPAHLSAHLTQR